MQINAKDHCIDCALRDSPARCDLEPCPVHAMMYAERQTREIMRLRADNIALKAAGLDAQKGAKG